ncbi:pre-peptidase C family protein [Leptolyngbyaceae cyanobacterium JSC-12]|nr:pre-peptidase C family protein [Leptolyngbyaceae cyanobacterium JSC-12]
MVAIAVRAALMVQFLALGLGIERLDAIAQSRMYNPIAITPGKSLTDKLTKNDIPTGQGGFARDYIIQLQAGSQVTIDVNSENFDSIVYLIAMDGTTVAENDDGPDGSTNSLLFTRIAKTGTYIIRVRSFGEAAGGNFTLKVTLLKPQ